MGDLPWAAGPALIALMTPSQTLTRRCDPHRKDCWLIYFGDVRVGKIARAVGNPGAAELWTWHCGFYPGSDPGEQRNGTAPSFGEARAQFERAWLVFSANRTEADYQEWREQKWFHRRVTASLTMLLDRCRCDNGTARG
jgi:hypothetical protein